MSETDPERARNLFFEALKRPACDRAEFLNTACADDLPLLAEVTELLRWHEGYDTLLDQPITEALGMSGASHAMDGPRLVLAVGSILKRHYVIERKLASGGLAVTFVARDRRLNDKPVVAKVFDRLSRESALATLQTEIKAVSHINHPSIAGITDMGELPDGQFFLIMDYIAGDSLRTVLSSGPISTKRALRLVRQIALALAAAHECDVWHLDLKPENVIVTDPGTDDERVTVIDFGVAHIRSLNGVLAHGGSPAYMAPEQIRGMPSAVSDIYGLGLLLTELLNGTLPSDRTEASLRRLRPDLPEALHAVVEKACASASEMRFQSLEDLVAALSSLESEDLIRQDRGEVRPRRYYWWAGVIAVSVLALMVVRTLWTSTHQADPQPTPLTTMPGAERFPALSPDGSTVYFSHAETGSNYALYSLKIGQPEPVLLTKEKGDQSTACSPDGQTLAFLRRGAAGKNQLILLPTSGGKEQILLEGILNSLTWSTDGKALVLSSAESPQKPLRLVVLDLTTHSVRTLSDPPADSPGDRDPALSPSGRELVFVRIERRASARLVVLPVTASLETRGSPRPLTREYSSVGRPAWTPDERSVLYLAGPRTNWTLWKTSLKGPGGERKVESAGDRLEDFVMARSGWRSVLSRSQQDTNIWRINLAEGGLRVLDSYPIVRSTWQDEEGALSPDAKSIAFVSFRTGDEQIWMSDTDGRRERQLTHFKDADDLQVFWDRNGNGVWVTGILDGQLSSRYLSIQTLSFREERIPGRIGGTSRDGRFLYLVQDEQGKRFLSRYEILTAKSEVLTSDSGVTRAVEAEDGFVYYSLRNHEIWRPSLRGGTPEKVISGLYGYRAFTVGRAGVYYLSDNEPPILLCRRFSDGAESVLMRLPTKPGFGFDVAQGDRFLTITFMDRRGADLFRLDGPFQ